ncbi:hypothetical protein ACSNOI_46045, partial [Actinomadura kijaniata]|uniref:hypothetical protein n=1 Tax=Actinomadura kijaniata TaxID=46161 RepID=UPI003F1960C5
EPHPAEPHPAKRWPAELRPVVWSVFSPLTFVLRSCRSIRNVISFHGSSTPCNIATPIERVGDRIAGRAPGLDRDLDRALDRALGCDLGGVASRLRFFARLRR